MVKKGFFLAWLIPASGRSSDLAGFNDRLASIDDATSELARRLSELTALVSASISSRPTSLAPIEPKLPDSPQVQDDGVEELSAMVESPHFQLDSENILVVDDTGMEKCYGPLSTYALFQSLRSSVEQLENMAVSSEPATNAMVASIADINQKCREKHEPASRRKADLENDQQPLELPPRALLEDSLEYYFEHAYLKLIIFEKETLGRAIEQQYNSEAQILDDAWATCFISIIVLAVNSKSKVVGSSRALTFGCSDENLLLYLTNNVKRALSRLEALARPRLVNLQALFLLVCDPPSE